MKFWTKRTAAVMAVLYIMLALQAITNPSLSASGVLVVIAGSSTLLTVIAFVVKWLYVTARTTPGGEEPEQEVEAAD